MIVDHHFIDDTCVAHLRRMLGHNMPWISGNPFLMDGDVAVTIRLAVDLHRPPYGNHDFDHLWFGSERLETAVDYLDYARFEVGLATSLGEALQNKGLLHQDTSLIVTSGVDPIKVIRIISAHIAEPGREIEYDALIRFELASGRTFTIGHAPASFVGVCLSRDRDVTLANPKKLRDRIVLAG